MTKKQATEEAQCEVCTRWVKFNHDKLVHHYNLVTRKPCSGLNSSPPNRRPLEPAKRLRRYGEYRRPASVPVIISAPDKNGRTRRLSAVEGLCPWCLDWVKIWFTSGKMYRHYNNVTKVWCEGTAKKPSKTRPLNSWHKRKRKKSPDPDGQES